MKILKVLWHVRSGLVLLFKFICKLIIFIEIIHCLRKGEHWLNNFHWCLTSFWTYIGQTIELKSLSLRWLDMLVIIFHTLYNFNYWRIRVSVSQVSSFDTSAKPTGESEKLSVPKMPKKFHQKDFILWKDSMHRDFTVNRYLFIFCSLKKMELNLISVL